MKSENFQTEDLLMNESFFNWVKNNNPNDSEFWEAWWEENPQYHESAREAIRIIESLSFDDTGFSANDQVELWRNIKSETMDSTPVHSMKRARLSKVWSSYLKKVAAVTIPILLGTVLYLYHEKAAEEQNYLAQQMIVKEIPSGQKLTVYLPDGSRVKLNSESKISYPKPFDKNKRMVSLEGEAFFEITPDSLRPFLVISKGVETRVVGTSFNVNAYSNSHVEVSVVSGKVSVKKLSNDKSTGSASTEPVWLSPAEQAICFVNESKLTVSGYNANEVLGWSDGVLHFNNASMEELVIELERWYGIDIIIEREKPIKKGIVGEFRNQSLEEIMMGLHTTSEFEYEFKNGKLIIK
ncbi:MAG: anti-sigma factor [Cyclobacteriaceae bacterium]|nr:MAG: anti-sigma factor [Cyclobacteriaceae bacterium]